MLFGTNIIPEYSYKQIFLGGDFAKKTKILESSYKENVFGRRFFFIRTNIFLFGRRLFGLAEYYFCSYA